MTDAELDALDAKAKAATPGPWYAYTDGSIVWEKTHEIHTAVCDSGEKNKNNAAFIAAANPATIQEMVADLKKARADACEWVSIARWLARELGKDSIPETEWIILARQALGYKNEWGEDGEATCTK